MLVRQIRIYAGVLLVTNTAVGVAVWAAFAPAGLPDPAGWGVTAAVFIGLLFWGALWGLWSLFLGPALVVVLKVAAEPFAVRCSTGQLSGTW